MIDYRRHLMYGPFEMICSTSLVNRGGFVELLVPLTCTWNPRLALLNC